MSMSRHRLVLALLAAACSSSSVDPRPSSDPMPVAEPVDAERATEAAESSAVPPEPEEPPARAPERPPPAPSLELTFVGDVIFGRYRPTGYDPIPEGDHEVFHEMAEALKSDLLVGNLETPLVRELPETSPIGARFQFGASVELAQHLVRGGFGVMSLANNHWFDMRVEGAEQTPSILRELGIVPLGAARTEPPLFRVETVERNGWRIGFLAATTRTNAVIRESLPQPPYLRTRDLVETLGPLLGDAREAHDLLIVALHWGDEYADAPDYMQIKAARGLVEAGADLVIGHHPHVLQGIEVHEQGLIAYSLGNFLFENTAEIPRLTGVLRTRFRGADARCLEHAVFHPAYIKRFPVQHPVPATGFMGRKVRARVVKLGDKFGTRWDEDGEDLVLAPPPCE
jgi:hypothetical protein